MNISVVISTYDNCARLRITLDAFTALQTPEGCEWELILVNNNCSDATDEVAAEFSDKLPLVYVHEPRPGNCRGRNAGIKAASGRLIVLTDEDVKPAENWLCAYWSAYQDKPKGFYFGGPIESEFEVSAPEGELLPLAPFSVRGLEWGARARQLADGESFIAPNWACPAEHLRDVGGFDTSLGLDPSRGRVLGGEEPDLMHRLGKRGLSGWYVPEAKVVHFVPAHKCTLKHIAARARASGYYLALSKNRNPRPTRSIFGVPRWMFGQAVRLFCEWVLAKIRGDKGYREYLRWQRLRGCVEWHRENFKHSADHSAE